MSHNWSLEIENLSVAAGGQPYVQDATLRVAPGRFHGLLGPNGSGKTTLLRTLYFANRPQSGNIRLLGRDQAAWDRRAWSRTLGVLVQGSGLLAGLTVADIIDIGLQPLGLPPTDVASRKTEALDIAGLTALSDQLAATLSGGELQRCYIAQILARDPEVYVLDEPTNHLDLHYQLVLLDEVKRRSKAVLATLHDLSMAARYCDEISLMDHGRIVDTGAVETVLSRERLAQTYHVSGAFKDHLLHLDGPL